MTRKTCRTDDIVWNVTESDMDAALNGAARTGGDLGALLDTKYPRKAMERLFESRLVFVNGHRANPHSTVHMGDEVRIAMAKEKIDYDPSPMDLAILYEDDDLLILDKPAGITMNSKGQTSLANGAAGYFSDNGIKRKVRFLNRLDRDTSGCVVIAKSGLAHGLYQRQMDDGTFEKWYRATVEGHVPDDEGSLTYAMRRAADGIHYEVNDRGKPTRTDYTVVRRYTDVHAMTDLDIRLYTGKTHQIRVAFSHLGHPLAGDTLYGAKPTGKPFGLRAVRVAFTHMRTGKRIIISVEE